VLNDVAFAIPKIGVTKVGEVANTNDPEPVSSVTADFKFALDGTPKKVATPAPKLVIEAKGSPVQFVKTPEEGVPKAGVTNTGEVAKTAFPVPVTALETKFFDASVKTACETVNDEIFTFTALIVDAGKIPLYTALFTSFSQEATMTVELSTKVVLAIINLYLKKPPLRIHPASF
jgi:hypothetical protein